MLRCLGQSPPWSRWERDLDQQGFSLSVYNGSDVFRKGFLVFPFGSPLLPSWHQGPAAAGKSWTGFEVQRRRQLFCLLPVCFALFRHSGCREIQAGSRQGKQNGFLVAPSASADLQCQIWDLPLSSAWLVSPGSTLPQSLDQLLKD